DVVQPADGPPGASLHYGFNDRGDPRKVQSPLEERLHRDLVCGVQHYRMQPSGEGRRPGEREATELVVVGRQEVEAARLQQVEKFYTGRNALGPGERVRDRRAHVG